MPRMARFRALYFLIALNLLLLILSASTAIYASSLKRTVEETRATARAGCSRGNVIREVARFVLLYPTFVSPQSRVRAAKTELQEQDCRKLYP